ncbi:MAG: glycosyltransferase family 2 protein [Gemmatimonadota bacterium]
MAALPRLSIVVPLFNEEESARPLVEAVRAAIPADLTWELVLIDDGSTDATSVVVGELALEDSRIRFLRLARNYGQTQAMQAGFDAARGDIVVSMDGDLQNDPLDIPMLVRKLEEGFDLVTGYRARRQDRLMSRKVPSWIANRLIAWLSGVSIRDNGCSLKAYRRELLERIHLYSDMHRFIPAIAVATAGASVAEIPVRHHARQFGVSKYGLSRVAKVLADLLTIKMIGSFRGRPLAMFAAGAIGAVVLSVLCASWAFLAYGQPSFHTAAYVIPSIAVLWLGLAGYFIMLGLLAEVAVREHSGSEREELPLYREWIVTAKS